MPQHDDEEITTYPNPPTQTNVVSVNRIRARRVLEPDEAYDPATGRIIQVADEPGPGDLLVTTVTVTRQRLGAEGPWVDSIRRMIRTHTFNRRCWSAIVRVYQLANTSIADALLHVYPQHVGRTRLQSTSSVKYTNSRSLVLFQGREIVLTHGPGRGDESEFLLNKLLPAFAAGTLGEVYAEYKLRYDISRADKRTQLSVRSAELALEDALRERSLYEDRSARYSVLSKQKVLSSAERRELCKLRAALTAKYTEPTLLATSGKPVRLLR